jgi:hypothetical protein
MRHFCSHILRLKNFHPMYMIMVKLKSIYFRNLPLTAHCRFCRQVSTKIANSPGAVTQSLGHSDKIYPVASLFPMKWEQISPVTDTDNVYLCVNCARCNFVILFYRTDFTKLCRIQYKKIFIRTVRYRTHRSSTLGTLL